MSAPGEHPGAALLAKAGELMQARQWTAAEQLLRRLQADQPGSALPQLALCVYNQERYAEALPMLESLADSGRLDLACAFALARTVEKLGDADRAVRVYRSIYDAAPGEQSALMLASALVRLARRHELDAWLPELQAAFPQNLQFRAARSEHALLSGDYATGFDLIAARWAVSLEQPKLAALPCPVWDGHAFPGTLLVTAEQGLGDEILSASMFEDLLRAGQPAVIECAARLLPVFTRSFPGLRFVDRAGDELARMAALPDTRKIAALELGRYFRRDAARMPTRPAWLVADPLRTSALRAGLQARYPGQQLVGISWRSQRAVLGDSKSIPLADLVPLLAMPGYRFVNLQYGDCSEDLAALRTATGIDIACCPEIDNTHDIDGLFALTAALDAVVSSSSTTAHVAGALGKPAWTLTGNRYLLWYWGYEGARSPWYPSMRLVRRTATNTWQDVAAQAARELATYLETPR